MPNFNRPFKYSKVFIKGRMAYGAYNNRRSLYYNWALFSTKKKIISRLICPSYHSQNVVETIKIKLFLLTVRYTLFDELQETEKKTLR